MAQSVPAGRSEHDDEVWAWLERRYREHRRQLYLFSLGVLGNREDAEDATQIVLLHAHRALVRGERPTWPRAWLFAIALNVCRRLRRQASARRALAADTSVPSPLQRGGDAPTGAEILSAVASLPPGQREIFLLRELQGLSYVELSERLGLSLAATESLLGRARRRLREQLAAPGERPDLGRSPRRHPLLGIPGACASLLLARGPAALKLAGLAGAAAIAPGVTIGLHVGPERSVRPALQAAAPPVIQPVQRTFIRPARRVSSSPLPTARTTRRQSPRPLPLAARAPRPASVDAATVATATAAAVSPRAAPTPKQTLSAGAVEVMNRHLSPAAVTPSRVKTRPPAKLSQEPRPVPVTPAAGREAVDDAVATAQGAVDDVLPAAPAPPEVPAEAAQDPAPEEAVPDPLSEEAVPDPLSEEAVPDPLSEEAVPDPPSVVQKVQDVASSAVPDVPDSVG